MGRLNQMFIPATTSSDSCSSLRAKLRSSRHGLLTLFRTEIRIFTTRRCNPFKVRRNMWQATRNCLTWGHKYSITIPSWEFCHGTRRLPLRQARLSTALRQQGPQGTTLGVTSLRSPSMRLCRATGRPVWAGSRTRLPSRVGWEEMG